MLFKNSLLALSTLVFVACGTQEENKKEKNQPVVTKKNCEYTYNEKNLEVTWTAYKFTEKVGVGGKFDSVLVQNTGTVNNPVELLNTLKFQIPIQSVNTRNKDRDAKIINSFFGTMVNTNIISGAVTTITGNDDNGAVQVALTMNNITLEQELAYTINDSLINLSGTLNLENWEAIPAITALNNICENLHKGEDGVSKLWPTISLNINTVLDKNCSN